MKSGEIAWLAFTEKGHALAQRLCASLGGEVSYTGDGVSLHDWTGKAFAESRALVFVGAAGIAVRAAAPYLKGKAVDPAVVAVDECARFAVPLLSGHLGGANALAREIALLCGAEAVITTATDRNGVFAFDEWARVQGLTVADPGRIKAVSAKLLAGETVTLRSALPIEGEPPEGVCLTESGEADVWVDVRAHDALTLIPPVLVLGVGCRRRIACGTLEERFAALCRETGILPGAVCEAATIDLKRSERGLEDFCSERGWPLRFFTAEELSALAGEYSASAFVAQTTGVDNVCERAAVKAAQGPLRVKKQAGGGVTLALAEKQRHLDWRLTRPQAKLYVVGLGPGKPDGMTLEARAALDRAELLCGYPAYLDLIAPLYPGKETCSTPMTQELARCRRALDEARRGRTVALVCSGDAGVYGMASPVLELLPDYPDVEVEIVPGVTAALSGAALLGAPLGHDFCAVSLSDLLTPWEQIEKRLRCAAEGDFAVVLYNPSSRRRREHLRKACDILLTFRAAETPCGWVRNIGREGEEKAILTLGELREKELDMFTTVFIGSSATRLVGGRLVTPRGYRA